MENPPSRRIHCFQEQHQESRQWHQSLLDLPQKVKEEQLEEEKLEETDVVGFEPVIAVPAPPSASAPDAIAVVLQPSLPPTVSSSIPNIKVSKLWILQEIVDADSPDNFDILDKQVDRLVTDKSTQLKKWRRTGPIPGRRAGQLHKARDVEIYRGKCIWCNKNTCPALLGIILSRERIKLGVYMHSQHDQHSPYRRSPGLSNAMKAQLMNANPSLSTQELVLLLQNNFNVVDVNAKHLCLSIFHWKNMLTIDVNNN